MTVIQDADLSTGYNCLRFMMVNQFMSKRLGPNEYTWSFREWRRQVTTLTKNGAKKLTNPMIPDSEMPDIRLTKEAEFKLYMASALRDAGLKTRDRGFLQSRCQRCFADQAGESRAGHVPSRLVPDAVWHGSHHVVITPDSVFPVGPERGSGCLSSSLRTQMAPKTPLFQTNVFQAQLQTWSNFRGT